MNAPKNTLTFDSAAVQSHLSMLQGVVGRLATNSASCKTWCVTLASALAVVVAESKNTKLLLVAAMPIILFGLLDAYYLGLERRFRRCYEDFVKKLHYGTATVDDAFVMTPELKVRGLFVEAGQAVLSFSIWPFYAGLGAILCFLKSRL